jgi:two-component sensor histidine kinase
MASDRDFPIKHWMMRIGEHPLLRRNLLGGLAVATLLVLAALALRFALHDELVGVPYITFYSAVAMAAFVGGWQSGLFATLLSVISAVYFLLPPPFSFSVAPLVHLFGLTLFVLTDGLIVLLTHIATRAAETNVALAEQRQVLMMELQHRIKNHLQLLSAMLATHARATTNERVRARLNEAGQRLQVIASTYDNLYEPGALIDMGEHLRKVCAFVESGVAGRTSHIKVEAVETQWPVERVIPLSLIANELLTNAVKHNAAANDLQIDVRLARGGDRMQFSVLTHGALLPEDFSFDGPGLGLRIASMLARQLDGELSTPRLPDAYFVVEFPETAQFNAR